MEAIQAILTRASVRQFTDEAVSEADLHTILQAAMSGPSASNRRPWAFLAVRDKEKILQMAQANVQYAEPLKASTLGILVCGDLSRMTGPNKDFWVIDGAIAAQNICLAAHALGLGACWLGTYPVQERVENLTKLFDLPENYVPHSIIAIGHPAPDAVTRPRPEFEEDRVHYEKW